MLALLVSTLENIGLPLLYGTGLLVIVYLVRGLVASFRGIFFALDRLQAFIYNPFRILFWLWRGNIPCILFRVCLVSGIAPAWWLLAYVITFPIRVINTLYFDILLFGLVSLHDALQEWWSPRLKGYRFKRGIVYAAHWLFGFPIRFVRFCWHIFLYICDSALMSGISLFLPTFTMFHGTSFSRAAIGITQRGRWLVGRGDFVGAGVYFGLEERTAYHYAPRGSDAAIILARVTPLPTRGSITLALAERALIGRDGRELSRRLGKTIWRTIEHFRDDQNWWEYCVIQPNKTDSFVHLWRARPIALVKGASLIRVWGGFAHTCRAPKMWLAGGLCWLGFALTAQPLWAASSFLYQAFFGRFW